MPSSHFPSSGGSGSIGGTIGSGQVAYGTSSDEIGGFGSWDGGTLEIPGDLVAETVELEATDVETVASVYHVIETSTGASSFTTLDMGMEYTDTDGIDEYTAISVDMDFSGGSGTVATVRGLRVGLAPSDDIEAVYLVTTGDVTYGAGVAGDGLVHFYASGIVETGGGTVAEGTQFYGKDLYETTADDNKYFLWYDGLPGGDAGGAGVFRVNRRGILAYYNPAFAKYQPGATDFERLLLRFGDTGTFGTDNVAYFGMEVGGTGTNRNLTLLGAGVTLESAPGTSTFLQLAEMSAPSAPAANGVRLYAVDNGGKTELLALFATGAAQRVAIQP